MGETRIARDDDREQGVAMEGEVSNGVERAKVLVVLVSHNRRVKTLACLEALQKQRLPEGVEMSVLLVDDGSTDGTTEAASSVYPGIRILQGDGSLYWAGGMRLGMSEALDRGADQVLWLNDDTFLFPDALERLLQARRLQTQADVEPILVGATCDTGRTVTTYGGVNLGKGLRRLRFVLQPVPEGDEPVACDTMNGNCVLIHMEHVRRLGGIHPAFQHALGDFDFGLRATRMGIPVFVIPGWVGTCDWNSSANTMSDTDLPLARRWRMAISVKGLPPRPWWQFVRTHGGLLSPLYFIWPYLRLLVSGLWSGLRQGRLHRDGGPSGQGR